MRKILYTQSVCSLYYSVLYSTLLAQAQNEDEKDEIEKKMESEPELKKILHALQATDKEDIVTEERARRQQDRRSRVAADIAAMDTEENQVYIYIYIPNLGGYLKNVLSIFHEKSLRRF